MAEVCEMNSGAVSEINYNFESIEEIWRELLECYDELEKQRRIIHDVDCNLLGSMAKKTERELRKRMDEMDEKFLDCLSDLKKIMDEVRKGNVDMRDGDRRIGSRIQKKKEEG